MKFDISSTGYFKKESDIANALQSIGVKLVKIDKAYMHSLRGDDHDIDRSSNVVEFETMEDLMGFIKILNCEVIVDFDDNGIHDLEIYNDYR